MSENEPDNGVAFAGAAFRIAAIVAALGVGLGAFGAHVLEAKLEANGRADVWDTAVFYHLVHAVALLALAIGGRVRRGPWICLLVGIVLFSGSLYTLALASVPKLGPVTPIGGVFFLVGWIWLAISGRSSR